VTRQQLEPARSLRGFTLMEVVISMAVLSVGFLMTMEVLKEMAESVYVDQTQSDLQKRVAGRISVIASEMQALSTTDSELVIRMDGVVVHHSGAPEYSNCGVDGNSISFRVVTGINPVPDPVPVSFEKYAFGNRIVYRWTIAAGEIPDNNTDDNFNGVVDDGYIVREEFDPGGALISSMVVEDHVPQAARIERVDDPNFGNVIPGFCVQRLHPTDPISIPENERRIRVTVQRSADQRRGTNTGTQANVSATRTVFINHIK
jgi:prepilin-type N-terminal cleavage/methylation domain-containing protein